MNHMNATFLRRGRVLLPLLGVIACYREEPLRTPVPGPATTIVVALTDSGTVEMGNLIGTGAMQVEGVVAAADEDTWQLLMLRVDHRDQRSVAWNREKVAFPRRVLLDPSVRTLDKSRSWLAAAAVTAGAFIAARAFHLIGADENKNSEPVPEHIVIPGGGR